jgi:hypothetical protein
MPRLIISFGFKDSFKNGFDKGLEARAAFKGLSKTSYIETFFLVETKAGIRI